METITLTELNLRQIEQTNNGGGSVIEMCVDPITDGEERISWKERVKLNPQQPWKATRLG